MRSPHWASARLLKPAVVVLVSALAVAFIGLVARGTTAAAAQAQPKMEATIFSYDGKDFVRTRTTMVTESGKSAVDTKLDHNSPAYKALLATDYAPLTGGDGRLTGALFIGVAK